MYTIPAARLALVGVVALSLTAGTVVSAETTAAPAAAASPPLELPEPLAETLQEGVPRRAFGLRLLQRQVRRVVFASRPATVSVEMDNSVGSGVIISPDGLVLTAGHVCGEPNRRVYVRFPDGTRVAGRSLGMNHELDSGLVRITDDPPPSDNGDDPPAWPNRPMATGSLEPGDWVVGLGHPNGFVKGRAPPVRLGRVLLVDDDSIRTDVTLVGGDSGGPLLNLRGEVVGIHSRIGETITSNYHVPVSLYRDNWSRLLAGRMTGAPEGQDPSDWRPHVGIAMRPTDAGPVVTQVFADEPADEAGVAVGDLIVSIAGESVDSPKAIGEAIAQREPFERVALVVRRGDESIELEVWLGRTAAGFPGSLLNRSPGFRRGR